QRSDETLDPRVVREVLDADHAGLEDVKDRIVEYLAVRKLRQDRGIPNDKRSGAILTLIGPPCTGKTSIGESVARALNREFDRMEVIRFDGYTVDEKTAIARGYLWPRQVERNGLREDEVSISDQTIQVVVSEYTREAGVRQLERELGTVLRKTATRIAAGQVE